VSRLHSIKRLVQLVEAFGEVAQDFSEWRLEIAGSEDEPGYRDRISSRVDALGLTSRVALLGRVTGMALWAKYQDSDLFVLPSESESFGLVVIEALAAGLPVIATRGTPWQALEDERCGWWTGASVTAMAATMRAAMILSDRERRAMGDKGADLIRRNYLASTVAPRLAGIYEGLARDPH
jgi:glycosyltransferase involved in cell wall biosynthesis